VGPGADDDALMGARLFAAAVSAHVLEVLQGAPLEEVVPAADIEGGSGDLSVATVRGDRPPIVAGGRMGETLEVERAASRISELLPKGSSLSVV
jgi:hypothetical protein